MEVFGVISCLSRKFIIRMVNYKLRLFRCARYTLFFFTAAQAILVYAIAIPFFLVEYSSLPMTVGILTGLMWLPFSWIIQHWVGIFHVLTRTVLVLVVWYTLPAHRFVAIPAVIVLVYVITMIILKSRKPVITMHAHGSYDVV
jgi:hypothetical protein